jgi:ribose-phosphate pyrophosphokinase
MSLETPLLFALHGSELLGAKIAQHLGISLAAHEERDFEDGEHKARPLQNVRGRSCYVLHALHGDASHSANDKLNRLLFFIATLKDASASRVSAVVPCLAYARKDRKTKPRDPVTMRYVAQLFEAMGTDALLALEVHNPAAFQNAFRCPTEQLDSAGLFARHIADQIAEKITDQITDKPSPGEVAVVSPDAGGVKRAALFRDRLSQALGRPVSMGFVEKYRSEGALSGELLVGDVKERQVLLFDDLISSGQTLLRAAAACRAHGAASVWAAAAHGLFNVDALQRLGAGPIDRIFVSDSIAIAGLKNTPLETKLDVVSCTAMLGEAIRRSHEGGSIVELMQS